MAKTGYVIAVNGNEGIVHSRTNKRYDRIKRRIPKPPSPLPCIRERLFAEFQSKRLIVGHSKNIMHYKGDGRIELALMPRIDYGERYENLVAMVEAEINPDHTHKNPKEVVRLMRRNMHSRVSYVHAAQHLGNARHDFLDAVILSERCKGRYDHMTHEQRIDVLYPVYQRLLTKMVAGLDSVFRPSGK